MSTISKPGTPPKVAPIIIEKIKTKVDSIRNVMIKKLAEYVAIQSISGATEYRKFVHQQLETTKKDFEDYLGAEMEIVDNPVGYQYTEDGDEIKLPGIILGRYPKIPDKNKKTLLIYGHLDVMPAMRSDGWNTDPFVLTEKDGKLYGRGASDDKAPILGWLFALLILKDLGVELPVNLKFCFEGMEESTSVGLKECLMKQNKDFFANNTDGVVISDNYWIGTEKPCLTYGLRGACAFAVTVEGASKDLHSGVFSGAVCEALTDLIKIMSSLVDNKGHILINGIYDDVDPLTEAEAALYKDIDFDQDEFARGISANLIHKDKATTLQHRWRYPTLSLHGIEGAYSEPGQKTVIPRRVKGKFTIRTVASMDPNDTVELVKKHIDAQIAELDTPNKVWLSEAIPICKPWFGDPNGYLYQAARMATKHIYKVDPDLTREGCSIPITIDFEQATRSPVILIPMGAADDGAHWFWGF